MHNRSSWAVTGFALLAAACASGTEEPLVGQWKTATGGISLRFAADGTFESSAARGRTQGTYARTADGRLRMEFDGMEDLFHIEVQEDRLTFCQTNYACERFQRVKAQDGESRTQ